MSEADYSALSTNFSLSTSLVSVTGSRAQDALGQDLVVQDLLGLFAGQGFDRFPVKPRIGFFVDRSEVGRNVRSAKDLSPRHLAIKLLKFFSGELSGPSRRSW